MDLGAFININELQNIASKNNIIVPRLRGYRLMKDEKQIDDNDLTYIKDSVFNDALHSCPLYYPDACEFVYCDERTRLEKKLAIKEGQYIVDLRWNLIHGKNKKRIKFALKKRIKNCKKQLDTFNKYVGRDDILYIHARIGGGNWNMYKDEVIHQPWFIEKVDDWFDDTYCDIYARIEVPEEKENENS